MSEWKESISLEETNRIRVSLGLKPISDAPSASKTAEALAEENFQKRKDQDVKEREQAALKARIDKARNQRDRGRKLVGVGLGADEMEGIKVEEGVEEEKGADAKAWVKKQKKRAKELAAKRAKEQEEMDRRFEEEGLPQYGEEDLKGIKVAHGEDDFDEGEETVLTLKDSRILDDEDDELYNLNIAENTKTAEALALKKKGKQAGMYTGYDDDEFDENGGAKSVLKKYDEDIEGKEEGGFRLGGPAPVKKEGAAGKGKAREDEPERERVKLSLDYTKTFTTDYLQEDEVGFKKPKKKKKRPTRTALIGGEDDEGGDASMRDAGPSIQAITRVNLDDTNLIDDDDLQAQLARTRREASKRKIAELKAFAAANPRPAADAMDVDRIKVESDNDDDDGPTGDDILVLDDTSEFVRNISLAAAAPARPSTNGVVIKGEATPAPAPANGLASVAPVIKSEDVDVPLAEVGGWGSPREDGEESGGEDDDTAMMEAYGGDGEAKPEVKPEDDEDTIGGVGEILVSKGMSSTLSILRQQGLLKVRSPEELAKDKSQKEREAWLAQQRKRDLERLLEKQRSKEAGSSKDQQQREYENRMRDKRDAEEAMRAFDNYKPVVNLTYHDEFGRNQTPKEAWKQLSHNFHGKTGGSKKTEKRLKKIADEQKQQAMASGDTPLSTATAFAARAERMGSATMILSVGNKGAAPQQVEMLGQGLDKRLKKGDKGKGKASTSASDKPSGTSSAAPAVFSDIPMRPLPLPSSEGGSATASPGPRAGFAPVRSFSPAVMEREEREVAKEKFVIPTSVKRKAAAEGEGSPASKKR